MEGPPPPRDTDRRRVIDKLAEFVARNGTEFETIAKRKQHADPKFEFLYGGEFYNYYQYRLAAEQSIINQQRLMGQSSNMQSQHTHQMNYPPSQNQPGQNIPWPNSSGNGSNGNNSNNQAAEITSQIEAINMQQNTLRDQIRQSEQNLSAQHSAMMAQQKTHIEEAITKAQNDILQMQSAEHDIHLPDFDAVLQPIIDSCTKDSISAGKNWILQHTSDTAKSNVVLQYLLKKALVNGSTFTQKLHLIYLVNDILHHCVRKNANELKNALENVVIPMFCSADMLAALEQKAKLTKLLSLWESKAKFFDACVISKLRSPESSMQEYKTNLMNVHNNIVAQYSTSTKATLDNYQHQHQIFIQHANQQISVLEQQKQILEQQVMSTVLPNTPSRGMHGQMNSNNMPSNMQMQNSNQNQPPPLMAQKVNMPMDSPQYGSTMNSSQLDNSQTSMYGGENSQSLYGSDNSQPGNQQMYQGGGGFNNQKGMGNQNPFGSLNNSNVDFQQHNFQSNQNLFPSVTGDGDFAPPNFLIPDLSKPPPGFMSGANPPIPILPAEDDPKPEAPYYDLPAGLMVPLIRLEDYNYKPLDPEETRLPPPAPQNERLTSALAAFYSLPSHDRPRDNEGWEKLALYEYYKVKNAAKKQKEEELLSGLREQSKSPSPIVIESAQKKKSNKRRYRSKSRSRSRSPTEQLAPKSPRKSRSKSRTPPPSERGNRGRNLNNRRSRTPPIKRSPIRDRERNRERDRDKDSERDRDRGHMRREREQRSVTPPSFFGGNYGKPEERIEETNKGHQMLMKMGWAGTGTGLGTKNQGIEAPISGGDVRDRKDMYKGIGINLNDPFENFRKNKGAAFIHRMRSRAEEKS